MNTLLILESQHYLQITSPPVSISYLFLKACLTDDTHQTEINKIFHIYDGKKSLAKLYLKSNLSIAKNTLVFVHNFMLCYDQVLNIRSNDINKLRKKN